MGGCSSAISLLYLGMSFCGSMAVSEKMIQCVEVSGSSWHNQSRGECDKEEEGGAVYSPHSVAAGGMNSSEHKCKRKRCTSVLPW